MSDMPFTVTATATFPTLHSRIKQQLIKFCFGQCYLGIKVCSKYDSLSFDSFSTNENLDGLVIVRGTIQITRAADGALRN